MFVKSVIKKDGTVQKFNLKKLQNSIDKSLKMTKINNPLLAQNISYEVAYKLDKRNVTSNDIRKTVEEVLKRRKLNDVYRTYSLIWLRIPKPKLKNVEKRSGGIEKFDTEKLFKSIHKALYSARVHNDQLAARLTKETVKILEKDFKNKTVSTDYIKSVVERVLNKHRQKLAAKHYVIYRYI